MLSMLVEAWSMEQQWKCIQLLVKMTEQNNGILDCNDPTDHDVHLPKKSITGNESKDGPDKNSGSYAWWSLSLKMWTGLVYDFHSECDLVLVIVRIIFDKIQGFGVMYLYHNLSQLSLFLLLHCTLVMKIWKCIARACIGWIWSGRYRVVSHWSMSIHERQ